MSEKLNYCTEKGECALPDDKYYIDCKYGEECLSWGCVLDHCRYVVGSCCCTNPKVVRDIKQDE